MKILIEKDFEGVDVKLKGDGNEVLTGFIFGLYRYMTITKISKEELIDVISGALIEVIKSEEVLSENSNREEQG